jgi:hypothetical protein
LKNIEDHGGQSQIASGQGGKTNMAICYVIFIAYIACLHGIAQKALYQLDQKIVPSGDAMTYSIFFYRILNESRESIGSAISLIANSNYNWLQDFLILIFSPFLYNSRSSLIIINCAGLLISMILIFRTALLCRVSQFWAFCAALLFAAMPWHFQMRMEFSLTSLMPEAVYMGAYLGTAILLCWLIAYPHSRRIAALTGVALGAAIWSRWNAIINLTMPIAGFGVANALHLLHLKGRPILPIVRNYAISALIGLAFAAIYFGLEYRALYEYGYQVSISSSFDFPTRLAGAKWLILNMPGLAVAGRWFWPNTVGTPLYAVALTVLGHVIALYAMISGAKRISSSLQREVLIGALGLVGGTIFYLDIILAVTSFGGFYSDVGFRELHFIEPALIGLVCCTLSVICGLSPLTRQPRFGNLNISIVYVVLAILAAFNSSRIVTSSAAASFGEAAWLAPKGDYGLKRSDASGPACEKASSLPDKRPEIYLPNDGLRDLVLRWRDAAVSKSVTFLWYGLLNTQIVDYYTYQANLSPIRTVRERSFEDEYVWYTSLTPKEVVSVTWFRQWLKYVLARSDYLVIPERLGAYEYMFTSPLMAYRDEIAAAVNSPDIAPDYVVWGVIEEQFTRVLILKKRLSGDSSDGLDAFPRTWGTSAQIIGRDFRGAFIVADKLRSPIQADATSVILFTYKNYNVLKLGDIYLGIAQELGAIDLEAVMAKIIAAPPTGQFIVAPDIASLEHAIDASILACQSLPAKKPVLLYTYKTYSIIHSGQLYVGVAWDVGRIDVDAVLANIVPRPPDSKFIVAQSIPNLEARIDDLHPVTNPILLTFDRVYQKAMKWARRARGETHSAP